MKKSVKISVQNEKTKRVLLNYSTNFDVENTTTSLELKKQIRETIDYPCEEFSQTLWGNNNEIKDEQVIPNNVKLEYVLLTKDKETPNPQIF